MDAVERWAPDAELIVLQSKSRHHAMGALHQELIRRYNGRRPE
jgi:hypothetical protein